MSAPIIKKMVNYVFIFSYVPPTESQMKKSTRSVPAVAMENIVAGKADTLH